MTASDKPDQPPTTPKPLALTPEAAALKGPPPPKAMQPPLVTPEEVGGPKGLEPTRFGDWERKGRCSDF